LAQHELALFLTQFALNDFWQFVSLHFKHVIALVFRSPDNVVTAADFARNIFGQERLRGTQTLATFQQEVPPASPPSFSEFTLFICFSLFLHKLVSKFRQHLLRASHEFALSICFSLSP
jgi:hypothetical protein